MNRCSNFRITLFLLPLFTLLVMLCPARAPATVYSAPQNISGDLGEYYTDHQINDKGWVVWSGPVSSGSEIFLYDGSGSPQNISNKSLYDFDPQINDDGWVVWSGAQNFAGVDPHIYLWKGSGSDII